MSEMNIGKVTQVIGPVLDIEFPPGKLPAIYNAVKLTNPSINGEKWNLVVEVAQHLLALILVDVHAASPLPDGSS